MVLKTWSRAAWREEDQDEECVIPSVWIDLQKKKVRWPVGVNVTKALNEKRVPEDKWLTFSLIKVKFTSDLKQECERYDDTTTAELSDEEDLGKRIRKKKNFPEFQTDLAEDIDDESSNRNKKSSACMPSPPTPPAAERTDDENVVNKQKKSSTLPPPPKPPASNKHRASTPLSRIHRSPQSPIIHQQSPSQSFRSSSFGRMLSISRSRSRSRSSRYRSRSLRSRSLSNKRSRCRNRSKSGSSRSRSLRHRRSSVGSRSRSLRHRRSSVRSRSRSLSHRRSNHRSRSRSCGPINRSRSKSRSRRSRTGYLKPHQSGMNQERSRSREYLVTPVDGKSSAPLSEEKFQRRLLYILTEIRDILKKQQQKQMDGYTTEVADTIDELKKMDDKLGNDDEFVKCKKHVIQIGGKDATDHLKKAMLRFMSNRLMSCLNMTGKHDKTAFKETNLFRVIRDAVLVWHTTSETIIIDECSKFLKYAPKRSGGLKNN